MQGIWLIEVIQSILVPFCNDGNSGIIQQLGLVLFRITPLVSPP